MKTVLVFLAGIGLTLAGAAEKHLEVLRDRKIGTDTEDILAFLGRYLPESVVNREVEKLVGEFSSPDFSVRETATKTLIAIGSPGRTKVIEAARSDDPETSWRATWVLRKIESDDGVRAEQAAVIACLHVLSERGEPGSVPTLMGLVRVMDDPAVRDRIRELVWQSADASHGEIFRELIKDDDPAVVAVAIVGLEISEGEMAVDVIVPFLHSDNPVLKLAAVRALVDRMPMEAVAALVEILEGESEDSAWEAEALLRLLAGKRPVEGDNTTQEAWQKWSRQGDLLGRIRLPLGEKRFDLSAGREFLNETFATPKESLAKGYGRFEYEAGNKGKAGVKDGVLYLNGDNEEGDQRLFITSERMAGRERWPDGIEVRTKLGGKEGNNFGWHLGVSIGRVKVLFHPGLPGGEFRAETTDTHDYIFGNEDMPFTPKTGLLYEMRLKARTTAEGADFEVTVSDAETDAVHRRAFSVPREKLGPFNRVGLERSGRRGAAAMFDSLSIKIDP